MQRLEEAKAKKILKEIKEEELEENKNVGRWEADELA